MSTEAATTIPDCPYCGSPSRFLESSARLYGGRDFGPVYACLPCEAWVGCHKGTRVALGRLANGELRYAKRTVHSLLDPLWQIRPEGLSKGKARHSAYVWLSRQIGVPFLECHVGMFNLDQCKAAAAALTGMTPEKLLQWVIDHPKPPKKRESTVETRSTSDQ